MYRKSANCHRGRRCWLPGAARTIAGAAVLAPALLAAAAAPATAQANPYWIHIAAGTNVTCGIREGNTLWCWGDGAYGELGTGHSANENQPQQVSKPTAGWASVDRRRRPCLRHPQRRHPVVLGLQRTTASSASATTVSVGPAAAGHHPGEHRLGQRDRRAATTPAPSAATAPCGAGATTATASSASATPPARICRSRSPPRRAPAGPASPPAATTPAPPAATAPCGAGATTATGELGIGNTTNQDLPQQVTTPAAGGWASVTAGGQLHLRHPQRRHPVVLGQQPRRPARHRQPHQPGPARSRSPPRPAPAGPAPPPAASTPAPPARTPCGAGASTTAASSASAAPPARTCRSGSPCPPQRAGASSPSATTTPAPRTPATPCGAGETTTRASSASAAPPTRTCLSRSPHKPAPGNSDIPGGVISWLAMGTVRRSAGRWCLRQAACR